MNEFNKIYKGVVNESSLSRIWQFVEEDRSFAVISASRDGVSDKENNKNYQELKGKVRDKKYGYVEMKGGYVETGGKDVIERSLFIPNIPKKDVLELGENYNQDSILYKDDNEFVLIGTNNDTGIGKILSRFKHSKGKENITLAKKAIKNYYSFLTKGSHKGKKFLFQIQEKEGNSFNKFRRHIELNEEYKWTTIFEKDYNARF